MPASDADLWLPSPAAVRKRFERVAASFDRARQVHDESRQRLLERLDWLRIDPALLLDIGTATGEGAAALAARYAKARVLALDTSLAMLARARAKLAESERIDCIAASAENLPLSDASVDLVFAHMLLPWCRPAEVFAETARVLAPGGLFLFSTLGPGSFETIRRAWARADRGIHVHAFYDLHDLGDALIGAGMQEPVADVDRLSLRYRSSSDMIADLRACGGVNLAEGRRRGLTPRRSWRAFEAALVEANDDGFDVELELIFGHAWRLDAAVRAGDGEARFPVERLRGTRRSHLGR